MIFKYLCYVILKSQHWNILSTLLLPKKKKKKEKKKREGKSNFYSCQSANWVSLGTHIYGVKQVKWFQNKENVLILCRDKNLLLVLMLLKI